jgi:HK97 family phage major capsid protein
MPVDVSALRQKRAEKIDRMDAIVTRAASETRDMSEVEATAYDELMGEQAGLETQIRRAEEVAALKAEGLRPIVINDDGQPSGQPRGQSQHPRVPAQARSASPPTGFDVVHMVKSLAATKGNLRDAAHFCETVLHNPGVAKALAAGTGTSGGFMVPENYVADIIEFLRPASVILSLNPLVVPMPNGTMTMPKLTGGSSAAYIGENTNIPTTQPQFGQLRLTARKLGAVVPISNDLLRFATPSADTVVRDDLVLAIAQRQDLAFIRDIGTGNAPKGLRYWAPIATNVIAANPTVSLANTTTDLGSLVLCLKQANVRMIRPGWIFSPRTEEYLLNVRDGLGNFAFRPEMLTGKLRTFPYRTTTQIPVNLGAGADSEVYLADFADVVVGDVGTLRLDASTEAAYFDGTNVVAAFSLDQTVVRAIVEHDIGMRHDFSVAVLTGVEWSP